MRKLFLLLSFVSIFSSVLFAQSIPDGMNYQAVARNLKGEILPNQPIALQVVLFSVQSNGNMEYYRELHDVVTSPTGVFSLIVGQGKKESGIFDDIPWSTENIWMEVSIKSKGQSDFAIVSNSKLLAVPYAFHAISAERLSGNASSVAPSGSPSQSWLLFGNRTSNPLTDKLGTTDFVDLVIVTNDLERLRIYADGNIFIKRSLQIGANLNVDSSAFLNRVSGATINYGPFTVERMSPTLLSGKLTVDKETDLNSSLNVDGPTDLNSRLNVNNQKPTKLTGTLQVDGVTTLNDSTFVANSKPTVLTGYLRVDSNATFKQRIILTNAALNQDTATLVPNGALQVAGGGGFGGNLTVAGSAKIGGGLTLGSLKVTDPIPSTSETTGAVTVVGGVGIGMQLNVGGKTVINNSLDVNAGNGQVKITGGVDGGDDNSAAYPLVVTGKKQGIEVKLSGVGTPDNSNNFITFKDNTNTVRGRIEGITQAELQSDPWYRWDVANYTLNVVWAGLDVVYATADLIAAISDFRACVGLGIVVCPPSPGTIIVNVLVLAGKIVQLGQQITNLVQYITVKNDNLGVSYSSSAGDYAEWLPKERASVNMLPGQVIGVRKGLIDLNTAGAERVLVISTNPIVLGNTPETGKELQFEKVAFLGQVPVRVIGKVKSGDYILASNKNDGTGIAKNPDDITIEDIPNIVGIAWTGSDLVTEKAIKVAVGLTANDLKNIVKKLEQKVETYLVEFNDLKKQYNSNNELLAKLIPGFKTSTLPVDNIVVKEPALSTVKVNSKGLLENSVISGNDLPVTNSNTDSPRMEKLKKEIMQVFGANLNAPEADRFPEMTDELIDKLLGWGVAFTEENGKSDIASNQTNDMLQKIKSNPQFKDLLYKKMKEAYKQKIAEQKMINQEKR